MSDIAILTNCQRFSLHDGPGIRTTFFFKGCSLNCKWCSNPETIDPEPCVYFTKNKCIKCGNCVKVCPNGCFSLKDELQIDWTCCKKNDCQASVNACPTGALRLEGTQYTLKQLVDIALADKVFYDQSDGGVTASGGEAMLQADFIADWFKELKKYQINTAIETAGCVPWENFEKILPYVDLFYYDIKLVNSEKHKFFVGANNALIHSNLKRLKSYGANIIIRVPLIPKVNTDEESMNDFINFFRETKIAVEVLPFHQLGKSKYSSMGMNYFFENMEALNDDSYEVKKFKQILKQNNIKVK